MPTRHAHTRLAARALIAPCGINCRVCRAHMRQRDPCPGCRADDTGKPKTRVDCRIKACRERAADRYCFSCRKFPCDDLLRLDARYRTRYHLSVIDNLERIRDAGVKRFVLSENSRWNCHRCGAVTCMHHTACTSCGTAQSRLR